MAKPQIKAFYNEINPHCCAMLQHLMDDGIITAGKIDDRPIQDIRPEDVAGYDRVHFFAGIGGWDVALNLTNWASGFVWTGSCPCQPFSTAGKQRGKADDRHLWPVWFRLIRESRPSVVYGEQVAAAIAHGWWDDVANDLESEGYATGAAVLPACSVGFPHKRDRLWFVANCPSAGFSQRGCEPCGEPRAFKESERLCFVGNSQHNGWHGGQERGGNATAIRDNTEGQNSSSEFTRASQPSNVANAECGGRQGQRAMGESEHSTQSGFGQADKSFNDCSGFEWIACPDGKQRPVKPGVRLLAHGVQHRAPILHAFGNAIVPQVAAAFIKATM